MGSSSKRRAEPPANSETERRASTRFPVNLEVRYTTWRRRTPVNMGTGRTVDVSSSGLSFIGDRPLLTGQKIQLYIDWPVLLNEQVTLQLVIWGVVVRTDGPKSAIKIQQHDFRTRSAKQRSA